MANFYIDINNPVASDNNTGSESSPWSSFSRAFCAPEINPGDTVFVKQGVYREEIKFGIQGTDSQKISFKAVPGHFVKVTLSKPFYTGIGHTSWRDYFGDFQIWNGQQFLIREAQPVYEQYICDSVESVSINSTTNRVFRIRMSNNFLQENDFCVFPALTGFLFNNIGTVDSYVLRVLKTEGEYSYFNAGSSIPTNEFNDLSNNKTFIRPSVRLGLIPGGTDADSTALSAFNFRYRHYLDPRLYGNEGWSASYTSNYRNRLYSHPFNASNYSLSGNNDLFYGDNIAVVSRSNSNAWDNKFLGIGAGPFLPEKFRNINGKLFTTWKVLSSSIHNVYVEMFLSGGPITYTAAQGLLNPNGDNGTRLATAYQEDLFRNKNHPVITGFNEFEHKNSVTDINSVNFGSFGANNDNFGTHWYGVYQAKVREILNTYPKFTYTVLNNNLTLPPVSRDIKYIGYKTFSQYFQLTSLSNFDNSKISFNKKLDNKIYPILKLNRIDFPSSHVTSQGLKYSNYSPYSVYAFSNYSSTSGLPDIHRSTNLTVDSFSQDKINNDIFSNNLYPLYFPNYNFYDLTQEVTTQNLFNVFKNDEFSKTSNSYLFSDSPFKFNKGQNYPAGYYVDYINNNVIWWARLYGNLDPSRSPMIIIPYHTYPFGTLVFSGSSLSLSETGLTRLAIHYYNQDRKNNLDLFRSLNVTRILTAGSVVNFTESNSFYNIDATTKNLLKQKDLQGFVGGISPFTDFTVISSIYNSNNKSTVVVLSSPQNYQINDMDVANIQVKAKNIIFEGIDFYASHGYVEKDCDLFFGLTNAENLEFINCMFNKCPIHLSNNVKNVRFYECDFYNANEGHFYIYNVPGPVTFDSCNFKYFNKLGSKPIELASNVIDHYSKDIYFTNCMFEEGFLGPAISIINNSKNVIIDKCSFKLINGPAVYFLNNSNIISKDIVFSNNKTFKFDSFISNSYQISACGTDYFICNANTDIKSNFILKNNFKMDTYFNGTSSFEDQNLFSVSLPSNYDPNKYVLLRAVSAIQFTTDENGLLSAFSGNQNIFSSFKYPELTFNSTDQTQKLIFDGNIFWIAEINDLSSWVRSSNNQADSLSAISEIKDCVFINNEEAIRIEKSSNINIFNNSYIDNNYGITIKNNISDFNNISNVLGDYLKVNKNIKILNNLYINNSVYINSFNDSLIKWKRKTKYFSYNNNPNDYCLNGQYLCSNLQLIDTLSATNNNNWITATNLNNNLSLSLFKQLTSINQINLENNLATNTSLITSDYNFYSTNNSPALINPGTGNITYFHLSSLPFILQKGINVALPYPAYSSLDPDYSLFNNIPKTIISINNNWSDVNSSLSAISFIRNKYSELQVEDKLLRGASLSSCGISYNFDKLQGSSLGYSNDIRSKFLSNDYNLYVHLGPTVPITASDIFNNNGLVKIYKTIKTGSGYQYWDNSTRNVSQITHFINNNSYYVYLTGSTSFNKFKSNLNVKRSFYDHFKY